MRIRYHQLPIVEPASFSKSRKEKARHFLPGRRALDHIMLHRAARHHLMTAKTLAPESCIDVYTISMQRWYLDCSAHVCTRPHSNRDACSDWRIDVRWIVMTKRTSIRGGRTDAYITCMLPAMPYVRAIRTICRRVAVAGAAARDRGIPGRRAGSHCPAIMHCLQFRYGISLFIHFIPREVVAERTGRDTMASDIRAGLGSRIEAGN